MDEMQTYALEAIKEQIEILRNVDAQDPEVLTKVKISEMICHLADRILSHVD